MSSAPQKEAPISEPLPCPDCGEDPLSRTIENCRLDDGFTVKKLPHYKCTACGARLFDDDAIHRIQTARAHRPTVQTGR